MSCYPTRCLRIRQAVLRTVAKFPRGLLLSYEYDMTHVVASLATAGNSYSWNVVGVSRPTVMVDVALGWLTNVNCLSCCWQFQKLYFNFHWHCWPSRQCWISTARTCRMCLHCWSLTESAALLIGNMHLGTTRVAGVSPLALLTKLTVSDSVSFSCQSHMCLHWNCWPSRRFGAHASLTIVSSGVFYIVGGVKSSIHARLTGKWRCRTISRTMAKSISLRVLRHTLVAKSVMAYRSVRIRFFLLTNLKILDAVLDTYARHKIIWIIQRMYFLGFFLMIWSSPSCFPVTIIVLDCNVVGQGGSYWFIESQLSEWS